VAALSAPDFPDNELTAKTVANELVVATTKVNNDIFA
jgi:hypothetical protein